MKYFLLFSACLISTLLYGQQTYYEAKYLHTLKVGPAINAIPNPTLRSMVKDAAIKYSAKPCAYYYGDTTVWCSEAPSNGCHFIVGNDDMLIDNNSGSCVAVRELFRRKVLVSDTLNYKWQIVPGAIRIVAGHNCMCATLEESPEAIVWFTLELPISTGPKGLFGLPGLIMRYEDPNETFELLELTRIYKQAGVSVLCADNYNREKYEYEKKQEKITDSFTIGGSTYKIKE